LHRHDLRRLSERKVTPARLSCQYAPFHFPDDREGFDAEVHYLRDRAGREADFLVALDRKPWFAVEAKLSATTTEPSLTYFRDRLRISWVYQVVLEGKRDFVQHGIRCVPARQFLGALV